MKPPSYITIFILFISFLSINKISAEEKEWLLIDIPSGWREIAKQQKPYPMQQYAPADESFDDPNYKIIRSRLSYIKFPDFDSYIDDFKKAKTKRCKSLNAEIEPQKQDSQIVKLLCPKTNDKETGYASVLKLIKGKNNLWAVEYYWRTASFKSKPVGYESSVEDILGYLEQTKSCIGTVSCNQLRNDYNEYLIQKGRRAEPGVVRKSPKVERW